MSATATDPKPKKIDKRQRVNPYKLAFELKQALVTGSISEIGPRLDRIFLSHFGVTWKSLVNEPKKRGKTASVQTEMEF